MTEMAHPAPVSTLVCPEEYVSVTRVLLPGGWVSVVRGTFDAYRPDNAPGEPVFTAGVPNSGATMRGMLSGVIAVVTS